MFLVDANGNNSPEALEGMALGRDVWVEFMNVGVWGKDMVFLSPWSTCSWVEGEEKGVKHEARGTATFKDEAEEEIGGKAWWEK